jgi:hypothetical protein
VDVHPHLSADQIDHTPLRPDYHGVRAKLSGGEESVWEVRIGRVARALVCGALNAPKGGCQGVDTARGL